MFQASTIVDVKVVIPFAVAVFAAAALFVAEDSRVAALSDPVANLGRQIERGDVKLDYNSDGWGYLPSLLKHLDPQHRFSSPRVFEDELSTHQDFAKDTARSLLQR